MLRDKNPRNYPKNPNVKTWSISVPTVNAAVSPNRNFTK
jgi:hypothetical protein